MEGDRELCGREQGQQEIPKVRANKYNQTKRSDERGRGEREVESATAEAEEEAWEDLQTSPRNSY